MTGLELLKAPEATAGEIADIISAPCPPTIPAHCDGVSCRACWLAYAHGLTLAGDAPAEAMNKSLQQVQGALDRKPEKKVDLGGGKKDKDESSDEGGSGKGKQVIIHMPTPLTMRTATH